MRSHNSLAECNELMPEWPHFVPGVVDSEDLQRNIFREALRQDKIQRMVKKQPVKTCLGMVAELAEQNDDYKQF